MTETFVNRRRDCLNAMLIEKAKVIDPHDLDQKFKNHDSDAFSHVTQESKQ